MNGEKKKKQNFHEVGDREANKSCVPFFNSEVRVSNEKEVAK